MPTILVIDDNQDNLLTMNALLSNVIPGCKVITALSGPLGIEKAKTENPDTILLDIIMPGMDGFEVCKILKKDSKTKHIPLIMQTACLDSNIRIKGLEIGAEAFINKPIDQWELAAQINAMLRIKHVEDLMLKKNKELQQAVFNSKGELKRKHYLNDLLLNSLPHPALIINSKREVVALNKIAEDMGAKIGCFCWKEYGHSISLSKDDKKKAMLEDNDGIKCTFCVADDCLKKSSTMNSIEQIGESYLNIFWVPIGDEDLYLHYAIDITELKKSERDLIESRNRLIQITEQSPFVFELYNKDGLQIDVNHSYEKLWGISKETTVNSFNIFEGNQIKETGLIKYVKRAYAGESVTIPEHKWDSVKEINEGRERWLSTKMYPLKNQTDEVTNVVIMHEDITERVYAEKSMKKLAYNLNQRVKEMNCIYNISKLIEEELSPKTILEHIIKLIPIAWQYPEITVVQIKLNGYSFESDNFKETEWMLYQEILLLGKKSGWIKICYLEEKPDFDEGPFFKQERELVIAISEILSRVIERKKMFKEKQILEAQLNQAQKMESIGTLAGGIAHDFNNILSPIVGYTEMLLEDVPEDSLLRNSLKGIYTSALRAKSLVKQILTFSRQESSELMLMKMQPIVKEALKLIRSTIPTTIEIKQDINPDCGVIKADPTQIHQIVMNLATNAYHAMEENGGELKVRLKEIELGEYDILRPDMKPGVYACLTVADTGKGMDKNLTDKIFDPFFTTKGLGKGTGLGLSVVHGIVSSIGGVINVYSEPEKGTEFHIYIPIENNNYENINIEVKEPITGGNEHILFVDDEEVILQMGKVLLERFGYHVTSHTSSLEALEVFRKNPDKFNMVITDMQMPNMPGDKLSAELIKIRPGIPILLCTGFSETMSEEKAASLGIKGFLFKPIIMKDLAQKIREVLDEE